MKHWIYAAVASLALTGAAAAADASKLVLAGDITLEQAAKVIDAAEAKAKTWFSPPAPFEVADLCLMAERAGRFHLVSRHALTG